MTSRRFTAAIAICLGTAALAGAPGRAFAHAHLKSATPVPGDTIAAAPRELDLTFSEDLNLKFSGVTVSGPGNAMVPTGTATLTKGGATLSIPLPARLGPGGYTVRWHALSADGHKTHGSYSFTVKP